MTFTKIQRKQQAFSHLTKIILILGRENKIKFTKIAAKISITILHNFLAKGQGNNPPYPPPH